MELRGDPPIRVRVSRKLLNQSNPSHFMTEKSSISRFHIKSFLQPFSTHYKANNGDEIFITSEHNACFLSCRFSVTQRKQANSSGTTLTAFPEHNSLHHHATQQK